jgi:uncharacterized protein YbbK (DUF523 family)
MAKEKQEVLVSACLLNEPCRWHGRNAGYSSYVKRYCMENPQTVLIPVCPELLGGLSVPRQPCKRRGQRVWETCPDKENRKNVTGSERTAEFMAGARKVLRIARSNNCKLAILCQYSPSCDATGLTGRLLIDSGIRVVNTF